ncbi:hypothetical protein Bca52824_049706 [Brassica carinata]|uniref:Reverse transcriptase zinc-binding domain-containing protein n=1 Tax=Brassica carinata TaxID=52824 RepID=A0A8X7UTA7_BRACI|nr:hypothetical protein Bca52824_049706 [Brassica carinata]
MAPKKKYRNALRGSSKMARLQAVSKPSISVNSLKKKCPIAGALGSVAEAVTEVAPETVLPTITVVDAGNLAGSSSEIQTIVEDFTPATCGEEGVACLTPNHSISNSAETPTLVVPEKTKETKSYASLLKVSTELEEIGIPSEHVSGVPFVLIPDENIAAAKEEFKEFIYARFHGDCPAMGRIIGVVNALWARNCPRIFVHNVGEGEFLLRVTNFKTREFLLSRTCWNVAGFPMFVAPWSPDFTPDEALITQAIVPVELRNVPYLLFNKESLSRLATAVGKPISLYPETERKENFKVAKLYVRVDLTEPLPRKIISGFSNGKETTIEVSYPWLPLKCELCLKYDHLQEKCRTHIPKVNPPRKRSASPSTRRKAPNNPSQDRVLVAEKVLPISDTRKWADIEEGELVEDLPVPVQNETDVAKDSSTKEGVVEPPCGLAGDNEDAQEIEKTNSASVRAATLGNEVAGSETHPSNQGLNSERRHTFVKDWITTYRPLFGAFLETHIQSTNVARIHSAIPIGWKFFGNYDHHNSGRIVVVWDPSVSVFIYKATEQAVTCGIYIMAENVNLTITFVYGLNDVGDRHTLWNDLALIQRTPAMMNSPWAVVGDFNQIMRLSHHSGYPQRVVDDTGMEDMNLALQDVGLFEAPVKGVPFTWMNNNDADPVSKRIDHALINQGWASRFPDAYADFVEPGQSDHAACIFKVPSLRRRSRKPFKFYHHIIDHPEYSTVVSEAWNPGAIIGTNQFKLVRSMKLLKKELRKINTRYFSGISTRVKEQTVTVEALQRVLLTRPDVATAVEEHRERGKLNVLLDAEQKFFRQRSRVRWADVGDRNTPFFHKTVIQRNSRNHIHYLRDENDTFLGTTSAIKAHAAAYFQNILGETEMIDAPVLSDFKALTGLDMNAAKSEIFFGGYTEIQSSVLSDIAGVKLGTFPTRYLGLPLNPSRVSYATLQPFLERITSKMHSWTVKNLSFAGKVRMVASVIYGMVNFWSSVFALPKRFYEKVDSLCCAFLWKNRTSSAAGARVSWSDICKPKKEGGLGLRRLEEFQQVFNLKRVWNFFSGSGSLWVAWLHSNVFSRRCYWMTADSQRLSPTVRSMIRIKETVAEFLRCSIGDGRAASFWYDYWTHMGPLIEGFGQRGPQELRITLESVVADATVNGEWQLPPARSNVVETLQIVLSTMTPPAPTRGVDRFLWRNGAGHFVPKFSTKATWHSIRETAPTVEWYSMVWFKEEIPRCSFVTWMAILSRLPTKDMLASWGLSVPLQCVLCPAGQESHQHLFFQCSFVSRVWGHFCGQSIPSVPSSFLEVAGLLSNHQVASSSVLSGVIKLLLQCIVYCVWHERNMRIFQQTSTTEAGIYSRVDRLMRDRLISIPPFTPSSPSPMLVYFRLPPPDP